MWHLLWNLEWRLRKFRSLGELRPRLATADFPALHHSARLLLHFRFPANNPTAKRVNTA